VISFYNGLSVVLFTVSKHIKNIIKISNIILREKNFILRCKINRLGKSIQQNLTPHGVSRT